MQRNDCDDQTRNGLFFAVNKNSKELLLRNFLRYNLCSCICFLYNKKTLHKNSDYCNCDIANLGSYSLYMTTLCEFLFKSREACYPYLRCCWLWHETKKRNTNPTRRHLFAAWCFLFHSPKPLIKSTQGILTGFVLNTQVSTLGNSCGRVADQVTYGLEFNT